jgi:hypothetical protein
VKEEEEEEEEEEDFLFLFFDRSCFIYIKVWVSGKWT